ncbi:adenylyltransferase/cytidyltransferase family protein [Thalassotalea atypica]|uniref:adenylyltransferase/cytidyltransferase family protein n=1 Tax=Thalassotalea atypica TaxID=2054316 RepID=UPI002572FAEF|nr:adenylyltransferase/cytidyltransferase family protein [Thalassotalea atypica]
MKKVYTSGVFDLFHVGHVSVLNKAKQFGDYLIVGVHSDEDVKSYKRIPVISCEQRCEIIRNIKCVDEVIIAPLTPNIDASFYELNEIDIHVAGDNMQHMYELPNKMGIMRYVTRNSETSSTAINNKLDKLKEVIAPPQFSYWS